MKDRVDYRAEWVLLMRTNVSNCCFIKVRKRIGEAVIFRPDPLRLKENSISSAWSLVRGCLAGHEAWSGVGLQMLSVTGVLLTLTFFYCWAKCRKACKMALPAGIYPDTAETIPPQRRKHFQHTHARIGNTTTKHQGRATSSEKEKCQGMTGSLMFLMGW